MDLPKITNAKEAKALTEKSLAELRAAVAEEASNHVKDILQSVALECSRGRNTLATTLSTKNQLPFLLEEEVYRRLKELGFHAGPDSCCRHAYADRFPIIVEW